MDKCKIIQCTLAHLKVKISNALCVYKYVYLKNQHIIMNIETETDQMQIAINAKRHNCFSKLLPKINAHGRGDFRSKKTLGLPVTNNLKNNIIAAENQNKKLN